MPLVGCSNGPGLISAVEASTARATDTWNNILFAAMPAANGGQSSEHRVAAILIGQSARTDRDDRCPFAYCIGCLMENTPAAAAAARSIRGFPAAAPAGNDKNPDMR